ncbi:SDR family NAD(P)-dependent oxidoreductase, partial [Bosea sp. CER48]|uniref:SDR family NAD(P)-dependent oxidoreductase n=1 Tax=Bosea sp. CER48 TaxID=3377035 RepID=UPI0038185867
LNAGIASGQGTPIDAGTLERVVAVNLLGVAKSFFAVQPRMIVRGRGQVAVNASLVGYRGLPGAAAYGAAKAGAIYFCESLRFDCAAAGIRLQLVNPGFVETPMTEGRRFPMPFLLPVEEGARRIVDGFERGGFEITFPRRLAWILKAARMLPYPVYFALMSRFAGKDD